MWFYRIDSVNNIISDPQDATLQENEDLLTQGLTEDVDYILSETYIKDDENYVGIMGGLEEYLWKNASGTPTLKSDSDKIDQMRDIKLSLLRYNYSIVLGNLDYHEGKAKTLFLEWVVDQIGDPPSYWTSWKSERDTIDGNYSTKKTYINDGERTFSELESYDVSL